MITKKGGYDPPIKYKTIKRDLKQLDLLFIEQWEINMAKELLNEICNESLVLSSPEGGDTPLKLQ